MTKDGSFKKVVRRHAQDTGQRYTEALTDLEGLGGRMFHQPVADRLVAHLQNRYGIEPVSATKLSVAAKSSSLSPGNPTMKSEVSARAGHAWRSRSTRLR